jgi:hypothetical protein
MMRVALENGGEVARGERVFFGGAEGGDDAAVAVVDFAGADEGVVDAVVVGARVVVGGDQVEGVVAGLDVFQIGAAAVDAGGERFADGAGPSEEATAVGEGGAVVGGDEVVGVEADAAVEVVDSTALGPEAEEVAVAHAGADGEGLLGGPLGEVVGAGGAAPAHEVEAVHAFAAAVGLVGGEDAAIGEGEEGGDVVVVALEFRVKGRGAGAAGA